MARVTVQIEDNTYDLLVAKSSLSKLPLLLRQIVEKFAPCTPVDRYLVLDQESVRALEAVLHGGQLRDAQDLVRKVTRHASIKIGNIELHPTPAQLEELSARAAKFNRTPEEEATIIYRQQAKFFFNNTEPPSLPTL